MSVREGTERGYRGRDAGEDAGVLEERMSVAWKRRPVYGWCLRYE